MADNSQQGSGTQSLSSADQSTAGSSAYASYYGYGSSNTGGSTAPSGQAGKYDAAMAAAQQFNAWQQQPPTPAAPTAATTAPPSAPTQSGQSTAAPPASAYAGYYSGYAAYGAGYGTAPTGATPAVTSASTVPQYYAGYR